MSRRLAKSSAAALSSSAALVSSGSAGAEAIELGDVTLLPGLIDMHTHMLLRDEDQTWPYSILWKTTSQAEQQ